MASSKSTGKALTRGKRSTSLLSGIVARARSYGEAVEAPNTRRAYASDWQHFTAWCNGKDLDALPASPGTVALYLTDHAGILKVPTLGRRLASISPPVSNVSSWHICDMHSLNQLVRYAPQSGNVRLCCYSSSVYGFGFRRCDPRPGPARDRRCSCALLDR